MTHFDNEDTQIRLEALQLANQVAADLSADPVDLAERYRKFLIGEEPTDAPCTINEHGERVEGDEPADEGAAKPNKSRPIKVTLTGDGEAYDHAMQAQEEARLKFRPNADVAKVYAQIMEIVHDADIFIHPTFLAQELGRVFAKAKARGE